MKSPKSKAAKTTSKTRKPATAAGKASKSVQTRKSAIASRASKPQKKATAPAKQSAMPPLLKKVVQALDDKKAERIVVLNVSRLSSITDYLVLGTATSDPHLRALRVELEKVIDADQTKILGIDTTQGSGWTVVDAFDVMVHLFTPENREKYRLETLWKDAESVPVESLV